MGIKFGDLQLFFFLSFFCCSLAAQEVRNLPLKSALETIEEKHNVRFSYGSNELDGINITHPGQEKTIEEILIYLNRNTPFLFERIDDRYIAVIRENSQSIPICGNIIDSESGLPLLGATIQSDSGKFATVTGKNGNFLFSEIPESEMITIRYLGYTTVTFIASEFNEVKGCKEILLSPEVGILQEVVLQNFFAKGINKNSDGAFTLNTQNLGIVPGLSEPDVLQMIQILPGISSVDETISNINIRGGTSDENLILWDNIKMYQNGHFFGLISAFNPYLTKNVTLYKNGTNARYGESVSGVIAMQSGKNIPKAFSGGIGINLINTGAFAEIPVSKKFGLEVSARRAITDFVRSPAYDRFYERIFQDTEISNVENNSAAGNLSGSEDFLFYDFSLKAIFQPSAEESFTLNFLTIDNSLEFTENFTSETVQSSETSKLDQRSKAAGLAWKRDWHPSFSTSALVYGTYYLLDATNFDIFSNQRFIQTNQVEEGGIKIESEYITSEKISLNAGYQFTETGISNTRDVNIPRFRDYVKEVLRTHAPFISGTFRTENGSTVINAGIRGTYIPKFESFIPEPRISIHQKLGSGFAVEVAGERKSQSVTQRIDFQGDFLGVEKRRWTLANDESVPVLESEQISASLLYQKNNWLATVEGFHKNVYGITTSNQGFQNQFRSVSTQGDYKNRGVEFALNNKTKNWSTWLSYTYLKSDYNYEELEPEIFPHNLDIRHQGTFAVTYSWNSFKIASGFNWHTGKPYTVPVDGNEIITENGVARINFAEPNQERMEDYYRLDLSAEYKFKLTSSIDALFNAAILNLTNRRNNLNTYYVIQRNEDNTNSVKKVDQVSLGITPNVSLQLLF